MDSKRIEWLSFTWHSFFVKLDWMKLILSCRILIWETYKNVYLQLRSIVRIYYLGLRLRCRWSHSWMPSFYFNIEPNASLSALPLYWSIHFCIVTESLVDDWFLQLQMYLHDWGSMKVQIHLICFIKDLSLVLKKTLMFAFHSF